MPTHNRVLSGGQIFVVFVVSLYTAEVKGQTDNKHSQRLHATLVNFRDSALNKCHIVMALSGTGSVNSKLEGVTEGTKVFARFDACLLADSSYAYRDVGSPKKTIPNNEQRFMDEGRRLVRVFYRLAGAKKAIVSVACDPEANYDEQFLIAVDSMPFCDFFAKFCQLDFDLMNLTDRQIDNIIDDKSGGFTAEYITEYGLIRFKISHIVDRDALSSVVLYQKSSDRYWAAGKDRLSGLTQSSLGTHPGGLISHEYALVISYDDVAVKPFSSISITQKYRSKDKSLDLQSNNKVVKYTKLQGKDEINALRIRIPEGTYVDSMDPKYKPLNLAYIRGDVVRRVDGASVDQVLNEAPRRSRALWLMCGLVFSFVAIGTFVLLRRKSRSRGKGQS